MNYKTLTCLLFACGILVISCRNSEKVLTSYTEEITDSLAVDSTNTVPSLKEKVLLSFCGDVMMGSNVPGNYVLPDSGRHLFDNCKQYFEEADIAIANQEGTIYDGTDGTQRKMTNPKTYFIFRTPGNHAINYINAGIDAVGIANNHFNDFGQIGKINSINTLKGVGLAVSGQKGLAEDTVIIRNDIRFGYLSFAASCFGSLDINDYDYADQLINKLRGECDVLIVTFHGGAEGTNALHIPFKKEYYVGEDRSNVVEFAHRCIDNGVDIVVGHGPHVPRALELYKGHLIAYSLGNFCTSMRMSIVAATGYAPLLQATINTSNGKFVEGKINSFQQIKKSGPILDARHNAAKLMKELTEADFPNTSISISEEGDIRLK